MKDTPRGYNLVIDALSRSIVHEKNGSRGLTSMCIVLYNVVVDIRGPEIE